MHLGVCISCAVLASTIALAFAQTPHYAMEEAIRVAQAHNPEVAIAHKKVEAARGGLVEARSGYLPAVVSSGLYRKRERQGDTRLRSEDYNANIRVVESIYTGGATTSRLAIARLNLEKTEADLEAVMARITMEVRIAFCESLLNRERIHVHEEAVAVLEQEVKTQRERFDAGTPRRPRIDNKRVIGPGFISHNGLIRVRRNHDAEAHLLEFMSEDILELFVSFDHINTRGPGRRSRSLPARSG